MTTSLNRYVDKCRNDNRSQSQKLRCIRSGLDDLQQKPLNSDQVLCNSRQRLACRAVNRS